MKHGQRLLIVALATAVPALALLAAGEGGASAEGTIIYVDADAVEGHNIGTSWTDAFLVLQSALDVAGTGDEIWVAEGTYKPTVEHGGTGARFKSFQMVNGVALYGGFDPSVGDVGWEDRDWENNLTILSGDLNGDDGPYFANNDENSYHVFYHPLGLNLESSAFLDGFTISGGNANGAYPHDRGGGMLNLDSSPSLINCTFAGNWASQGGGMSNAFSSPELINCSFSGNSALMDGGGMHNDWQSLPSMSGCTFVGNSAESGGGMCNQNSSMPTLTNCIFSDNLAQKLGGGMLNVEAAPELAQVGFEDNSADKGGGMYNSESAPTIRNSAFTNNIAYRWGGAIYSNLSSPALSGCIFTWNWANEGGGIYNAASSATLTGCDFAHNSAYQSGGGIYNYAASPELSDCTFDTNSADRDGGGIYNLGSRGTLTGCTFSSNSADRGGGIFSELSYPVLTNCTFWGNSATSGGGMSINDASPVLTNCTFWGNSAASGGGIFNDANSAPAVTNCILWGDTAGGLPSEITGGSPVVSYSDVEGGYPGTGNIDVDPLFVDPANGDVHLSLDSMCIDVGNNAVPDLPLRDFEGDPRIMDGDGDGTVVVDMGVDEVWGPPPPVIYVDQNATGTNSGTSWADALTDLQDALNWAVGGVEIWTAEGTYKPTNGTDRTASFQMINGVAIYGGFAPSSGDVAWEHRDWENNLTILSGNIGDPDRSDDNSYHVFYHPSGTLDSTAILDGFTLSGGNADGAYPHDSGGGMFNWGSSPALINLTFAENRAGAGGGMWNDESSPTLSNCTFTNNSAIAGGGIYNYHSSPELTGCSFSGNTSDSCGGGMYNQWSSSLTIDGSTFSDNGAGDYGGGIYNSGSSPTLIEVTFLSNTAEKGGGMYNSGSLAPTLTDSRFEGNTAEGGGGMYNNASSPTLTGCTFSGNSAGLAGGMYNDSSSPTLTSCIFAGNEASALGGGMYNEDASPVLGNCTFAGNTGVEAGGGIFNAASSPTLTNCTLWDNSVVGNGGGIYNTDGSAPAVANSILWANAPDQIYDVYCSPVITYSDIEGGYPGVTNIDEDPLFVDPGNGDYHLGTGSPCIDAGSNAAPNLPDYDFEGDDRIVDGDVDGVATVDMGVDEALLHSIYMPLVLRAY